MKSKPFVKNYAEALATHANENNLLLEALTQLHFLSETMDNSLIKYMDHPGYSLTQKQEFTNQLAEDLELLPFMHSFLVTLIQYRRFSHIHAIIQKTIEFILKLQNKFNILIQTARPLAPDKKKQLEKLLSEHGSFIFSYNVDASLKAGIILKIKNYVLDNSLKKRLIELKQIMENPQGA